MKRIVPRALANGDVEEAIDHYLVEATAEVALGFVDELEKAYAHIGRHPESGSPRYAHQLGLADLRVWRLGRYPYLVFYVERDEHIDVWRVLHEQRNIPAWMNQS
ncbi:MAG: type II toxin-antitoxin system RelE/ParE family toxin [Burkholderiales bacterium]|nr:type II toxin-antitoxin system RelE/ParE family toxin [Burkholderiales bacterium]MDE2396536.1 type II toxin-antitoxin system RelE/ParE family toxin [Burkholderiales bacterium]MDE2453334.1 type II toxin-antitoxin system RelE/ParE family toxin [Burkholderiales bacterium]